MARGASHEGWEEQGALPGPIVVVVDGINQDEQDQLELENFARGLSAPAKEDPGGKAYARTSRMRNRAMSPTDAIRLVLAFVLTTIAYFALADAALGRSTTALICVVAFVLGLALPSLVRLVLARRAAPVTRTTRGTFQLRFDVGFFSCSGAGIPEVRFELARVRSFTGGRRLSVELTDAPAATLPLSVTSRNNAALAARLNDLLAASRATTSRAW